MVDAKRVRKHEIGVVVLDHTRLVFFQTRLQVSFVSYERSVLKQQWEIIHMNYEKVRKCQFTVKEIRARITIAMAIEDKTLDFS